MDDFDFTDDNYNTNNYKNNDLKQTSKSSVNNNNDNRFVRSSKTRKVMINNPHPSSSSSSSSYFSESSSSCTKTQKNVMTGKPRKKRRRLNTFTSQIIKSFKTNDNDDSHNHTSASSNCNLFLNTIKEDQEVESFEFGNFRRSESNVGSYNTNRNYNHNDNVYKRKVRSCCTKKLDNEIQNDDNYDDHSNTSSTSINGVDSQSEMSNMKRIDHNDSSNSSSNSSSNNSNSTVSGIDDGSNASQSSSSNVFTKTSKSSKRIRMSSCCRTPQTPQTPPTPSTPPTNNQNSLSTSSSLSSPITTKGCEQKSTKTQPQPRHKIVRFKDEDDYNFFDNINYNDEKEEEDRKFATPTKLNTKSNNTSKKKRGYNEREQDSLSISINNNNNDNIESPMSLSSVASSTLSSPALSSTSNDDNNNYNDNEYEYNDDNNDDNNKVTGAGIDIFALQDAGSFRFVQDDCLYLCSSFLSELKHNNHHHLISTTNTASADNYDDNGSNCDKTTTEINIIHNGTTADTICELIKMLSSKKIRNALMNSSRRGTSSSSYDDDKTKNNNKNCDFLSQESWMSSSSGNNDDDYDNENDTVVHTIFELLSNVPSSINGNILPPSTIITLNDDNEEFVRKNENSYHRQKCKRDIMTMTIGYHDYMVSEALALLAQYLSYDCTWNNKYSASSSLAAASSFRKSLLQHKGAIRGIARLCLADQLVTNILCLNCYNICSDEQSNEPECMKVEKDIILVNDQNDSNGSKNEEDKLAIKKRRKRRIEFSFTSTDNKSNNKDGIENPQENTSIVTRGGSSCNDPTKVGRRKKKSKMKKLNNADDKNSTTGNCSSNSNGSTSSMKEKYDKMLQIASKCIFQSQCEDQEKNHHHDIKCTICSEKPHKISAGFLALDALKRIITGKLYDDDKDDVQHCDEEKAGGEDSCATSIEIDIECDEFEKQSLQNPLIFRNIMVRRSGALPILSRAMTESLEATIILFEQMMEHNKGKDSGNERRGCSNCVKYLCERVQMLSSILDALCCLSAENRKMICSTGMEVDGFESKCPILIPGLLKTVTSIPIVTTYFKEGGMFQDVVLTSFRTLTSLTHENDLAANQLLKLFNFKTDRLINSNNDGKAYGIEVLSRMLYRLAKVQEELRNQNKVSSMNATQHNVYDAIVFSMNMITNVLETASSIKTRKILCHLKLEDLEETNEPIAMLIWLTKWVVNQTSTFQDAVIIDSSSKSEWNEGSQRDLEHHEDDYLVQAGNGFILLACLLTGNNGSSHNDNQLHSKIHQMIMSEMPKDDRGNCIGYSLIVNTLKAFCNYYKYSIGELSVAVVQPVMKLISKLEHGGPFECG